MRLTHVIIKVSVDIDIKNCKKMRTYAHMWIKDPDNEGSYGPYKKKYMSVRPAPSLLKASVTEAVDACIPTAKLGVTR